MNRTKGSALLLTKKSLTAAAFTHSLGKWQETPAVAAPYLLTSVVPACFSFFAAARYLAAVAARSFYWWTCMILYLVSRWKRANLSKASATTDKVWPAVYSPYTQPMRTPVRGLIKLTLHPVTDSPAEAIMYRYDSVTVTKRNWSM